jgi:hypothetical protein
MYVLTIRENGFNYVFEYFTVIDSWVAAVAQCKMDNFDKGYAYALADNGICTEFITGKDQIVRVAKK